MIKTYLPQMDYLFEYHELPIVRVHSDLDNVAPIHREVDEIHWPIQAVECSRGLENLLTKMLDSFE